MIHWCYDLYILIIPSVIIDYTTVLLQTSRSSQSIRSHSVGRPPHFSLALVYAGVQVDEDVDGCDDDFGGDENNDDPFEILACSLLASCP